MQAALQHCATAIDFLTKVLLVTSGPASIYNPLVHSIYSK